MQLTFDLTNPVPAPVGAKPEFPTDSKADSKADSKTDSKPDLRAAARPEPEPPAVYSVGELTRRIKRLLEDRVGAVRVEGEISNYRQVSSGHHYFSLKDESAVLGCVLFSREARSLRDLKLANGLSVQVWGDISVYERGGNYQLIVRHLQTAGMGALQQRFEALKRRLEAEGLFAAERKRTLPRFLRRIGLVTSPTGAAIRDFLQILWRRHPGIEVVLHPVPVQGAGAAQKIAEAVATLNALPETDRPEVLVLTRGGGSLEDLWEFNEEAVARAVATSALPVVSAVGHEIDVTLCDFAADLRAPTPSAAAELLSADAAEIRQRLADLRTRLERSVWREWRRREDRFQAIRDSTAFRRPERSLGERAQEIDRREETLQRLIQQRVQKNREAIAHARKVLQAYHPARWMDAQKSELENRRQRLTAWGLPTLRTLRERVESREKILRAFDPQSILTRGYVLVFNPEGELLKSAATAQKEEVLVTRFADGELRSVPQAHLTGAQSPKPGRNIL